MTQKTRAHLIVTGRVQGVFFRAETSRAARSCGVTGWVRNLPDGTVEAVAEGARDDVGALVDWCRHGPPSARVDDLRIRWQDYQGEFDDFQVRY